MITRKHGQPEISGSDLGELLQEMGQRFGVMVTWTARERERGLEVLAHTFSPVGGDAYEKRCVAKGWRIMSGLGNLTGMLYWLVFDLYLQEEGGLGSFPRKPPLTPEEVRAYVKGRRG